MSRSVTQDDFENALWLLQNGHLVHDVAGTDSETIQREILTPIAQGKAVAMKTELFAGQGIRGLAGAIIMDAARVVARKLGCPVRRKTSKAAIQRALKYATTTRQAGESLDISTCAFVRLAKEYELEIPFLQNKGTGSALYDPADVPSSADEFPENMGIQP